MGVAGYVAVAALRSEIGASMIVTRIMETVLLFAKDTLEGDFQRIKNYMEHEIVTEKGEWIKTTNRYLKTLNMSWEKLRSMDRSEIKKNIREWDTEC